MNNVVEEKQSALENKQDKLEKIEKQEQEQEQEEENESSQSKFIKSLNVLYEKAISGITGSDIPPAQKMGEKYLEKYNGNKYLATTALIKMQYYKTFGTGFASGLGGITFLPFTLPADLSSSLFIEMRMLGAIAYVGGYDLKSQKAKSLVFVCLLGGSVKRVLKNAGVKLGQKTIKNALAKIPEKMFIEINKKVGIQLFAKLSGKGFISVSKAIPILGGIIGGGINIYYTKGVGKRALDLFIIENMTKKEKEENLPKEKEGIFSRIKKSGMNLYEQKIKNRGNKNLEEEIEDENIEENKFYKEKEK